MSGENIVFYFLCNPFNDEGTQTGGFQSFRCKMHMSCCHNSLSHYRGIKFKKVDVLLTKEATTVSSDAVLFVL